MVQAIGVEMLNRQDALDRGHALAEEFRLAQVSAGVDPKQVYADYFTSEVKAADGPVVDTTEGLDSIDFDEADFSGVTWQSPSEMGDDELAMLQRFMASDRVIVAEKDLGEWH